ncbi:MAG: DUF5009 domain-containing protein [Chitinophagaceae bacterium]|nr:DUF5009 domain-containing protein [Chitinophagaceae bacterium]
MNQRFYSLDVFRGATVALMILVNNPGSWSHIYAPLKHAPWHGCTPTDLVFPFFLFAVGNALAFVMPRLESAGTKVFLRKVITRTLLIFLIGLFLNWWPFVRWSDDGLVFKHWVDPANPDTGIRILGVLQRIALAYFFASMIIYFFRIKGAFLISTLLLLIYWWLCLAFAIGSDPFSMEGWFGNGIDRAVLGTAHMYKGEGVPFEPEGLASTLPAIVQVIFGYFVGDYIQKKGKNTEMLTHLFVAGCILVLTAICWEMVFPINKKIWTSSYVLYTTGLAILVLSVMIHLIEFRNQRGALTRFFDVFGKNPLFIFFLSGFLPRLLALIRWEDHINEQGKIVYSSPFPWFYEHICKPLFDNPKNGSLLYALAMIAFYWAVCYWLDRKRIYIKV